jgi:hypothetical protein
MQIPVALLGELLVAVSNRGGINTGQEMVRWQHEWGRERDVVFGEHYAPHAPPLLIEYGGATHPYRDLRNGLRQIFVGSDAQKFGKDWCWFFL